MSKASRIEFGTDGIRDVAGQGQLTPESVERLGTALADWLHLKNVERRPVLLGGDTRKSRASIVQALSRGLSGRSIAVIDVGVLPTAALALLIEDYESSCSVVISASHNPASDNGIKIFTGGAEKLADEDARWIEDRFESCPGPNGAAAHDLWRTDPLGADRYLKRLIARCPDLDLSGMRIVLDMAHGAAFEVGPRLFRTLGAEVVALGVGPDGANINDGCGALHPEPLAALVREQRADFGLAVDGDADRSIFVDETGAIVDGDGVLAAIGEDLKSRALLRGARVVGTVMTNFGLELFLRSRGIELLRTPVGDRHVSARLRELHLSLGGEPSGHIIFGADLQYLGDGLYTGLRIADLLHRSKIPLSRWTGRLKRTPQVLINVRVKSRPPLERVSGFSEKLAHAEERLGSEGRVVVRYSGTEALVRVMVEGTEESLVRASAADLATFLGERLG